MISVTVPTRSLHGNDGMECCEHSLPHSDVSIKLLLVCAAHPIHNLHASCDAFSSFCQCVAAFVSFCALTCQTRTKIAEQPALCGIPHTCPPCHPPTHPPTLHSPCPPVHLLTHSLTRSSDLSLAHTPDRAPSHSPHARSHAHSTASHLNFFL